MRTLLLRAYAFFMNKHYSRKRILLRVTTVIIAVFWLVFLSLFVFSVTEKKLYPVMFYDEIVEVADRYNIDRAFMFSVVRTESGFDQFAVSAKGAEGLMQITPSTGKFIADKQGITEYDLFNAKTNLDFGGYYIMYLSERFNGLTEMAAAYNAGEGTVKKWLKNSEYSDDGVRLNKIPYSETERYVKKIYESLKIYRKLYGKLLDK